MSKLRKFILLAVACLALSAWAQDPDEGDVPEWYLDEVVNDMFVGRYDFEFYYMPSAAEMSQQRGKGEVSYFLNTPTGLNRKKTCDLIDRIMASYDDVKAVGDWHMTTAIYWKEFRVDRNKFRFNVKRKALDDGTYYVSVTETVNHYKSLSKNKKSQGRVKQESSVGNKPAKRSTRRNRKPVVDSDDVEMPTQALAAEADGDDEEAAPVVSEKQRRREAREQKAAEELAERARLRRAQEKRREEAKAQKEAEKQRKAEEKRKKEEEKRLKKEEEKRQREEARKEREQERREQAAARKQASSPKPAESKYHYTDVALWLSEKYDFTQTAGGDASCTMYSTVVKDVEMAKLAIKNALKGSNARMAVPWRVNSDTQAIETGYTVDGHVLVFTIGSDDTSRITLTITEVSADEFESFKQGL